MTDMNSELAWEQHMLNFGVNRFRAQEHKSKERGEFTATNGGRRLLKGYLSQVSEFIAHYCAGNAPGGRRRSKYAPILDKFDPDQLALFSLTEIVASVFGEADVTAAANRIGVMMEDELKFTKFSAEMPELFNRLQRELDNRNSDNYRHRHRVLTHAMNRREIEWRAWGTDMCVDIGLLVLSLALDATDLVTKETVRMGRKSKVVLRATPEVLDWIARSDDAIAVLLPDRMPTIIAPDDWTSVASGGYHLPRLRSTTGLVKFRRGRAGREHRKALEGAEYSRVMAAVNAMQRTAWTINEPVLRAAQAIWEANLGVGMPPSQPYTVPKCPVAEGDTSPEAQERLSEWKVEAREIYALEKERQSLVLGTARTLRIAEMMRENQRLYFVYQLDFRGRVYAASSGVSPQGSDLAKAVMKFADGKPLGERGLYWLKVHGANKFGNDKGSYDERVAWIDANRDRWLDAARDPVGFRENWRDADKPYQFLAFCLEYAAACEQGADFVSHLPIALDGSCNGLQHFSAMLRDSVGGAAVNLVPADRPADIYQDVADVCTGKLRAAADGTGDTATAARNWLALFNKVSGGKMPRKASKKPVMTLPYGSTQQACTQSLFSWYVDAASGFFPDGTAFKHCIYLSSLLWDSIGEVVIAARAAMKWLQQCASILAADDVPLSYTTALGFRVYQGSPNMDITRICHRIGGAQMRLNVAVEKDGLCSRKQRLGVSPNLVHSVDATHMMMCVNAGVEAGITSFAMIHDDFGTHACHIDDWHRIIREQFVTLHTEFDALAEFRKAALEQGEFDLPPLPGAGSLDLDNVLKSKYFFG